MLATIAVVMSLLAGQPADEDGWRPLFSGKGTDGWQMVGPGELALENGELVTRGGMGLYYFAKEKLENCQVRIVFKTTGAKDNSGVFIRIPELPSDPWYAVHNGYEVQINAGGDDHHRTGVLYSLTKARSRVETPVGDWVTMLITLDGPRTRVEVNGELVTDFKEGDPVPPRTKDYEPERKPRPAAGYIGLQNHDEQSRVHFKDVSVRPLKR
jgi:3-keto-disaccharide hydrolase